jgi:hypothetical protein
MGAPENPRMGLGKTLTSLVLAEMYAEEMSEMRWVMGKQWENNGKTMGKWENNGKMGKRWENDRAIKGQ